MSTALTSHPSTTMPGSRYLVGSPGIWARDWAIIGAGTGVLAPLGVIALSMEPGLLPFAAGAGVAGGAAGAVLGATAPRLLERVRGRVPLPVLMLLGLPLGATWGVIAGGLGALWLPGMELALVVIAAAIAGVAGAIQLGLTWLPYTVAAVTRRPVWPVVLGSVLVAPAMGWAALLALVVGAALA